MAGRCRIAKLSKAEISELLDDYAAAAQRALAAGLQDCRIHVRLHGLSCARFLSPLSEQAEPTTMAAASPGALRLWHWNCPRVRAVWPDDLRCFSAPQAVDGVPEGWSLDDTVVPSGRTPSAIGVDVMDFCLMPAHRRGPATASGQSRNGSRVFQVTYAAGSART